MRRVMVLGGPGSGKSHLARLLGHLLGVPVFHLDRLHHGPNWVPRPCEDFAAGVAAAAALPGWVIDGNYVSTAGPRLAAADTIVWLDTPRPLRMWRVLRRIVLGYGRQRPDSAEGCRERFDAAFLLYAWRWEQDVAPRVERLTHGFAGEVIRLGGRGDVHRFVRSLNNPASGPVHPRVRRAP